MTTPSYTPDTHSPSDRADRLLAMTKRLITLVTAEIEALKAKRLDGASADWDEKERLGTRLAARGRSHQGQSVGAGWR